MQLSPLSRHFIPFWSKYSPQHLVLKHPQFTYTATKLNGVTSEGDRIITVTAAGTSNLAELFWQRASAMSPHTLHATTHDPPLFIPLTN
jgi:hypothetical protein